MELSLTSPLERSQKNMKLSEKPAAASASQHTSRPIGTPKADRLEISGKILNYLDEQNRRMEEYMQKMQEKRAKLEQAKANAENGERELDALGKALKTMEKCQKIAMRIMRGDKVPPEDRTYLMENDPDGYKLALACRKPNPHPKKWKSVLDDEDRNGETEEAAQDSGGEGGESVSGVEASGGEAPAEGGGE